MAWFDLVDQQCIFIIGQIYDVILDKEVTQIKQLFLITKKQWRRPGHKMIVHKTYLGLFWNFLVK